MLLRTLASLAFVVASVACERPPPAQPLAAVAVPQANTSADDSANTWLPKPLPHHGYVVGAGGLGGFSTIVVDYDAHTIRYRSKYRMEAGRKVDRSFEIGAKTVARLRAVASAAANEQPHGEMPEVSDVDEMFYAIDGDRHVEITGTLFDATGFGPPVAWRPMAARVLDQTYALAKTLGVMQ